MEENKIEVGQKYLDLDGDALEVVYIGKCKEEVVCEYGEDLDFMLSTIEVEELGSSKYKRV